MACMPTLSTETFGAESMDYDYVSLLQVWGQVGVILLTLVSVGICVGYRAIDNQEW